MSFTKEYDQGHNYAETLLQKIKPPRKRFFFNSKTQSHFIQTWYWRPLWYQIVGKFGFASHTKHTAEATNIYLLHLWEITCNLEF